MVGFRPFAGDEMVTADEACSRSLLILRVSIQSPYMLGSKTG
jgi:hypothetical protein